MPQPLHTRDYAGLTADFSGELQAVLLAPIPGDRATGENLRFEGTYDRIAEARREDDARLGQGVWEKDPKRADWVAVAQIAGEALELRSKDLQIAAWLTEAWCHLHGFAGTSAGLRLIHGLCDAYWDDLYPPVDDPEFRAAPFNWLDEKLGLQLKFVPLTQPSDLSSTLYAWSDWETAVRNDQLRLQNPANKALADTLLPPQIESALRQTPLEYINFCQAWIAETRAEAVAIEQLLEARLPAPAPGLRQFRATLDDIAAWLAGSPRAGVAADTATAAAPPPASTSTLVLPSAAESGAPTRPADSGRIHSRAEAYQLLADVAAYLLRTEPHSPTPYLIQRAIRWGSLPLDQLLPEMLGNNGALSEVRQLLNLKPR